MAEAAMEYAVMENADAFGNWMAKEVADSQELLRRLGILND